MSVDQATRGEVYRVVAKRWRRSILAGLSVAYVLPATSGGHDPVCPFWERGTERPLEAPSIMKARPREGGICPFTPQEIIGNPGEIGAGYLVNQIITVASSTTQPGGISEEETRLELRSWFHLPQTKSIQIRDFYTGAYRQLWKRVRLGAEVFAPYFTGINPVFEIRQKHPIGDAVSQGIQDGYEVILQTIILHRRTCNFSDPVVA